MSAERTLTVRVKDGLHARPAATFVKLAKGFASDLSMTTETGTLTAKSTVKLMLLSVKEGEKVTLRLDGPDELDAANLLEAFLLDPQAGLDALDKPAAPAPVAKGDSQGVGASEGIAIGATFPFFTAPVVPDTTTLQPAEIPEALKSYRTAREATIASLRADAGGDSIVEALISVAEDEDFAQSIEAAISGGQTAFNAVLTAGQSLAASFEAMSDPYQQARAEDIRSIARAIALTLRGTPDPDLAKIPQGSVILAEELSALALARAPFSRIGGIVCTKGSATSHVAIMARTHGIPAVLGFKSTPAEMRKATTIALDGSSGEVALDPDDHTLARFRDRLTDYQADQAALAPFGSVEPATRSGQKVEIAANLGSLRDIAAAKSVGAMGVGLLRTEMLFMDYRLPPDEDEQAVLYHTAAEAFAPYPVIIRALDIGADKSVPGVMLELEENPFLGFRGIRLLLQRPEIFRPQVKAVLRAATLGNVKFLIPMISSVGEITAVHALMAECRLELDREGKPHGKVELGTMIETPAAALLADDLAACCDFFSIGTNDLSQYITAADRMNPQVAGLCRADHPAVLKAIEMTCASAKKAGIWVGVCGEAAGDPALIPFFVANGVRELSMSPSSVLRAKKIVTEL